MENSKILNLDCLINCTGLSIKRAPRNCKLACRDPQVSRESVTATPGYYISPAKKNNATVLDRSTIMHNVTRLVVNITVQRQCQRYPAERKRTAEHCSQLTFRYFSAPHSPANENLTSRRDVARRRVSPVLARALT